jgi:ketosteroid isomerase-like protein
MSEENVEIVRAVFEELNGGDREKAIASPTPRSCWMPLVACSIPTRRRERRLRKWLVDTDDVWEGMHTEQNEFIDAGDRVVVIGRLAGKGKSSGVEIGQPNATILTIRDGLVIRSETGYTDRREALEAVGLSEQDAHADS